MRSFAGSLVVRGVLSVIVGIVALVWPDITVGAFVILFAIYAFLMAIAEFMRAFAGREAGPVIGRILLALLDIAAGVIALVWPDITALALVLLVAFWALVIGIVEFGLAFSSGRTAGDRALFGLTGLVSIALGVALVFRPNAGAITLAEVYGLFSLFSGISALVLAFHTNRAAHALGGATA